MHASALDNLLWLAGDVGQLLLLLILIKRRLRRVFPVFLAYISWQLISDLILYLTVSIGHASVGHYFASLYFSLNIVTYLLELSVLLEIGANVLRPAKRILARSALYFLLGIVLAIGIAYFLLNELLQPIQSSLRVFLAMDTTAAILCVVTFLLIAGFSQVLGLTWKSHIFQLATGLAFYSVLDLVVELLHSQLNAGPSYAQQYQFWGRVQVVGYLCTLSFWCYAFLKKEAPRKEFSPQMERVLVYLSGSTKRQSAVLARSREL